MSHPLPILDDGARRSRVSVDPSAPVFRIGDLAKRANKSARAVRLYEEKGLLGPALRSEGGHRMYAEEALERLAWIEKLQLLGLSLSDIKAFLDELNEAHAAPAAMERARNMFEAKLLEVRAQIASLAALESELLSGVAYLAACQGCAPQTERTECSSCGQPHPVDPPPLVMGLHPGGEGKNS